MVEPLAVYLQDNLAGARLAVHLLEDLRDQASDSEFTAIASKCRVVWPLARGIDETFSP